jgi:hypothetical protein
VQFLIDSKLRVMDDRFVLARSHTGAALSVVSGDYHIVQPKKVYPDSIGKRKMAC